MIVLVIALVAATAALDPPQNLQEKRIKKIFMYNMRYDLNAEEQRTSPVEVICSESVVDNRSSAKQQIHGSIRYWTTASSTFAFNPDVYVPPGIPVEITAGTPIIGPKTTIGASSTTIFTSGSTTTRQETGSMEYQVEVPGKTRMTIDVTGTQYRAEIPYAATVRKVYQDGSQAVASISGVYYGKAVADLQVRYSKAMTI